MPNLGLSKGPVPSNFPLNPIFKKDRLSPSGFLTVFLGVLLVICSARLAPAQTAGTITGTIVDQSGAVIPDATVTLTNSGTGVVARTLKTSAAGTYVAEAFPVGTYQISLKANGFQRAVPAGIGLNEADRLGGHLAMKVAEVSSPVAVNEAATINHTHR